MSNWSQDWSRYTGKIKPEDVVVTDVRLESNAGWYVGALQFYNVDEFDFYSRDSDYYPNEEMLKEEYPRSVSLEEARNKPKRFKKTY